MSNNGDSPQTFLNVLISANYLVFSGYKAEIKHKPFNQPSIFLATE
jgi:hypothetical protein